MAKLRDILELIGMACIGVGLWFVAWQLSLIVIGIILLAIGLISRLRKGGDVK